MPFYHFSQNNSFGEFKFDEATGLTHHVVIEAETANAANEKLQAIGGYFDGVNDGIDCLCCGDRWYKTLEGKASPVPSIYGRPISEGALLNFTGWMPAGREICVHYADGKKQWHYANWNRAA